MGHTVSTTHVATTMRMRESLVFAGCPLPLEPFIAGFSFGWVDEGMR